MIEVLLRFLYGATAVMAVPRRSWRCRGDPTADWPNPRGTVEVLNMFTVSAVPPRRSAVLIVFRGATAINDGTTAECRTSTAGAPRLRCDGNSTAETRRNMFKVAAVLPRRSAVLTVFRGATTINDGTTAEPRRSWRCHCGLCRTSTAVAPRLRCINRVCQCAKFNQFLPARSHVDSKRPENFVRIATFPSATFGPLFAFHCPLFFYEKQ